MSDTIHPESPPRAGVPNVSEQAPITPNAASANTPSDFEAIPEEILEEWRWIMKGRDEGVFDEYPGKHVAVYQQKIWGSSYDPDLLREYLALKHQIDPERFVIVYIDRW